MLYPPVADMLRHVDSRYLLVNVVAHRARQIAEEAEAFQEELERRLRGRGDTPEEQIRMRLNRAHWEMEQAAAYDYTVINDQAQSCADEIIKIIAKIAGPL